MSGVMDLRAIEREQKKRVEEYLLAKQPNPTSSGFNTASELGFECLRYQVARRIKGDMRQRAGLSMARSFFLGTVLESPIIDLLRQAGFKVFQDPSTVFYEWQKYRIKGRTDGKIEMEVGGEKRVLPLEVKTCSQRTWAAVMRAYESGEPLWRTEQVWLRKWPAQLTIYMLLTGSEVGEWVFLNKESGELMFWMLPLDYEYAERLIKLAEETNRWVDRGELPEAVRTEWCAKCDFRDTLCFVGEDFGKGVELVVDEQVEDEVARLVELEDKVKEYEALKSKLIGSGSRPGLFYGRSVVVGDVMITAKERKMTKYEVPEEVRNKYRVEGVIYVHKVERLKGDDEVAG